MEDISSLSDEVRALIAKKALRMIDSALEEITPKVDLPPRDAERIRGQMYLVITDIVDGYNGKYPSVPTAYLAGELIKFAEDSRQRAFIGEKRIRVDPLLRGELLSLGRGLEGIVGKDCGISSSYE